jgi:hypothetical protein
MFLEAIPINKRLSRQMWLQNKIFVDTKFLGEIGDSDKIILIKHN